MWSCCDDCPNFSPKPIFKTIMRKKHKFCKGEDRETITKPILSGCSLKWNLRDYK